MMVVTVPLSGSSQLPGSFPFKTGWLVASGSGVGAGSEVGRATVAGGGGRLGKAVGAAEGRSELQEHARIDRPKMAAISTSQNLRVVYIGFLLSGFI
jgi:hypothetical protein